ncbi:MAG: thiamine pyrophosphate-dependent enzyme [Oscillospiraceae bacterium]
MKLKAPESVFSTAGFCPGCGHGLASRLIGEVAEEMGINEKLLAVVDVACCSFNIDYWNFDTIMAAHGRDIPTAVGVKHVRPENAVMAYLGDGAAYSIGLAETVHAAVRNDNICVFVINNTLFGMTGGQMAPTTLPGQKTATSPKGKDPARYGTLNVVNLLDKLDIAYLARGELVGVAGMNACKKMIRKAFEKQMAGEGFSLVELLSPCPTNFNMTPSKAKEHIHTEVTKFFPVGEFIDKGGKK